MWCCCELAAVVPRAGLVHPSVSRQAVQRQVTQGHRSCLYAGSHTYWMIVIMTAAA
jgi:hypothetical protein